MGEGCCPDAERADAGEESDSHHVLHGHVGDAHAAALLDTFQEVLDESVHPLAETLKHNKSQRDSQDGIKHAEGLSCISPRRCMTITWEDSRQTEEISAGWSSCGIMSAFHCSRSPASPSVYKHDHARTTQKSLCALPKGILNRCMPQKCVCSLILFGLKDYGKWIVQLVRSFRWGIGVWRRDWKGVMGEPVKLLA